MLLLWVGILLIVLVIVWKVKESRRPPAIEFIRTVHQPFHATGNQVKPHELLKNVHVFTKERLIDEKVCFEFYPNQKIVAILVPPSTQAYCYCNMMEYLDLTRAIEKKVLYNQDPVQ